MKLTIRPENPEDKEAIHAVVQRAFQNLTEPLLVERLHQENAAALSLVAEIDKKIIGYILFSPMTLDPVAFEQHIFALAPLAVLPEYQKQGTGSKLVRRGLSMGISSGWKRVFVLGSPTYYSQFGFKKASDYNYFCEYESPDENFMVVSLDSVEMPIGQAYLAQYHPLFKELSVY